MHYPPLTAAEQELIKPMDGSCYCSPLGMAACYRVAEDILFRKVPGAFVQCGVANGGMAGCMAKAMVQYNDLRPFHLYDSFVGIPFAGPWDTCQPGVGGPKLMDDRLPLRDRLKPSGIGPATPLNSVQHKLTKLYGLAMIPWQFHPGWFQDTLPIDAASIGPIALLHLDGDLYESTIVCLEHLYPRVSPGGIVIIDDYDLQGCRQAAYEYFHGPPPGLRMFADYGAQCFTKPEVP